MTRAALPVDLSGPQASWPGAALRLWRDATEHVLAQPDVWHPAPIQGERCLRVTLGAILHEDPDQILITSGVRAAASVIARGARAVLHERPSFTGTVAVLRSVHPDLEILSWADLLAKSRSADAAAGGTVIWLTTPCRNPDGATLARDVWEWIDAVDPADQVVLNEVYRWFGLAPERQVPERQGRVWRTGSLSKLAGGGAGLGWIRGRGVENLAERQHSRPSRCWQRCWCYLLEHGAIELFVDHTVRPAVAASRAFTTELRRVTGIDHRPGGRLPPFLLLPVPTATGREFADRLRAEGIHVGSGEDFLAPTPSIRVCFVNVSEAAARHAARRIGVRLAGGP
jgi:DNA-binding transcriptional MocR family regulator